MPIIQIESKIKSISQIIKTTNWLYQLKTSEQQIVTSNTRDSIATLLLTRSVVVIATAAESAPYAS